MFVKLSIVLPSLVMGVRKTEVKGKNDLAAAIDYKSGRTVAALQELQREGVTPGVEAAIGKVVEDLHTIVMPQIEKDHKSTIVEVNRVVDDLKIKTTEVGKYYDQVQVRHQKYYDCMKAEKGVFDDMNNAWTEYTKVKGTDVEPCNKEKNNEDFEATLAAMDFSCSLALDNDCDAKMEAFEKAVEDGLTGVETAMEAKQAVHAAAKLACQKAKDAIANAKKKYEDLVRKYNNTKLRCEGLKRERNAFMCPGFSKVLEYQCLSFKEYEDLVAAIAKVNGDVYSHPDRVAEYTAAKTAHCVMEKFLADVAIDSAVASACAKAADFEEVIGIVPLRKAEVDAIKTEDKNLCQSSKITFGPTWTFDGTSYVEEDKWDAVLKGDYSFDFCE